MEFKGELESEMSSVKLVDDYYQNVFSLLPKEIEHGFGRLGVYYSNQSGDIPIDGKFLSYLLLSPEFNYHLLRTAAKVNQDFTEAVQTQDPTKVTQAVFMVTHQPGQGIRLSVAPVLPVVKGIAYPEIQTEENPDSQALVGVQIRSPLSGTPMLTGVERDSRAMYRQFGGYRGDLLAFPYARKARQESIKEGTRPAFTVRYLNIAVRENMERSVAQVLFVREQPRLENLSQAEYLELLKKNNPRLKRSRNEDERRSILNEIGFKSCYFELTTEQFYHYPMVPGSILEHLIEQIVD